VGHINSTAVASDLYKLHLLPILTESSRWSQLGKFEGWRVRVMRRMRHSDEAPAEEICRPVFEAHDLGWAMQVAPIPSLVHPDSQPLHHPIKYGRHLLSKVLSNFELHPNEAAAAI